MKLDLDLVRRILLRIEEKPEVPPRTLCIEDFLDLCDNKNIIALHIQLMMDAGWIDSSKDDDDIIIYRLTFKGYEDLAAIHDDGAWRIAMNRAICFGGLPFELIKEMCRNETEYLLGKTGE